MEVIGILFTQMQQHSHLQNTPVRDRLFALDVRVDHVLQSAVAFVLLCACVLISQTRLQLFTPSPSVVGLDCLSLTSLLHCPLLMLPVFSFHTHTCPHSFLPSECCCLLTLISADLQVKCVSVSAALCVV